MTLDDYLASPEFRLFQDERLRTEAIRAADTIMSRTKPVKRHQLHSIPAAIQGTSYAGLAELTRKQKEKNTNKDNKVFWSELDGVLAKTSTADTSLYNFVRSMMIDRGFIQDDEQIEDKKERRQLRKRNESIIETILDRILGVYFEHFCCHYFYRAKGDRS